MSKTTGNQRDGGRVFTKLLNVLIIAFCLVECMAFYRSGYEQGVRSARAGEHRAAEVNCTVPVKGFTYAGVERGRP